MDVWNASEVVGDLFRVQGSGHKNKLWSVSRGSGRGMRVGWGSIAYSVSEQDEEELGIAVSLVGLVDNDMSPLRKMNVRLRRERERERGREKEREKGG
jgi:hypothetical protein